MPKVVMKGTGHGSKHVKDYHKGTLAKNEHDVASKKVHAKYGTMGRKKNYGVDRKALG